MDVVWSSPDPCPIRLSRGTILLRATKGTFSQKREEEKKKKRDGLTFKEDDLQ